MTDATTSLSFLHTLCAPPVNKLKMLGVKPQVEIIRFPLEVMDPTRLTKVYRKTHHRMSPQFDWTIACTHIGIYPYPIAQKEAQPITLDNMAKAFRLDEVGSGGGDSERMWFFYTASLEYEFSLALVPIVTDGSGCPLKESSSKRRFLLYNFNKYQTLLFEEDIGDAAALIRLIVRFAGSVKGAEDCPIEIHDTTRFYTAGGKDRYDFDKLSFRLTGYTWYGGILPGLVPAKKMDKLAHESPYRCERDYKVLSIPLSLDEKRSALLNVPTCESQRLWNYGDLSYFNSFRYWTDECMKVEAVCSSPLSEWWILPAEAVRAFCATSPITVTRKTRKMRRGL